MVECNEPQNVNLFYIREELRLGTAKKQCRRKSRIPKHQADQPNVSTSTTSADRTNRSKEATESREVIKVKNARRTTKRRQ